MFDVFVRFSKFSDLFEHVWMHLDAFGCVWMRLDAFGCAWMRLDEFGKKLDFIEKNGPETSDFHNLWQVSKANFILTSFHL